MCLTPGVSREEVSRMGGGYRGGRTEGEGTRFMSTTMDWLNPFVPTVAFSQPILPTIPTFAVRETDVSRHNGGTSGAPLKPLRDDSALRALYRL